MKAALKVLERIKPSHVDNFVWMIRQFRFALQMKTTIFSRTSTIMSEGIRSDKTWKQVTVLSSDCVLNQDYSETGR